MIKVIWLTVNRACNFRCPWCYAKGTKYSKDDNMSFDLAKRLVSFSKSLGAQHVLLIGGEPTYYPHLFELISYIRDSQMSSTLVTNGYRFKDIGFVRKIENSGLDSIGFSIKAANISQQKKLTKVDVFNDIKQAIKNLSTIKNVKVGYSTVISNETIDNMEEFAQMLAETDSTKYLKFSMCNPMFDEDGNIDKRYVPSPQELVRAFMDKFEKLSAILKGKVSIEQNIAMCLWPNDFIQQLKEKNQISFGCHLQSRTGLVFDKNGRVIPCNSLPAFPIGQFGVDFHSKEEFEKFWMSEDVVKLYDKIYEYPAKKCQSCDNYAECGGGCPLKWFAYNAQEILDS